MSQKQDALDEIVQLARLHNLTLQEITESLNITADQRQQKSSTSAIQIFGYIGGILILGGVSVLIHMQWDHLSSLGHVLITLIPGFAAFIAGIYCVFDTRLEKAATPLFLLAAAVEPTGILIALKEYAHGNNPAQGVLLMCFIMVIQQSLVFLALKRTSLAFTSIAFALSFLATAFDLQAIGPRYIGLIIGASDLCIAYTLSRSRYVSIAPINYIFGAIVFLSSFGVCVDNTNLELSFLALTAVFIYFSIPIRSRALLSVGALAMLSFIGYYSEKHFSGTIGWPLTLIIGGCVMIGLGIMVIKINSRYILRDNK